MASSLLRFLDHTQRRITVGRTPLDEWSARCRDLYLTTHNTHNRQTSMPPVGFEPTISTGEQPQGTTAALWLRCYATNRKVAGSIPASVSGFLVDIQSFRSHYGPLVDSASNRNECQEHFLGVKAAGAEGWQPTTILCRCHEIWEP